jgi:hypothetical protein
MEEARGQDDPAFLLRLIAQLKQENAQVVAQRDQQIAQVVAQRDQQIAQVVAQRDQQLAQVVAQLAQVVAQLAQYDQDNRNVVATTIQYTYTETDPSGIVHSKKPPPLQLIVWLRPAFLAREERGKLFPRL